MKMKLKKKVTDDAELEEKRLKLTRTQWTRISHHSRGKNRIKKECPV